MIDILGNRQFYCKLQMSNFNQIEKIIAVHGF